MPAELGETDDLERARHDAETADGSPARAPAGGLRPAQLLDDRFEVLAQLGQGGMGVVYRARDLTTQREVAIKLLRQLSPSSNRLERFRREGSITAALVHPGIVRVHSAGEVEGQAYLVYELVEGCRTLGEVFQELPLRERVARVRDAARALGHAHANGVVHRDVKPENILVDASGRVRVADFGLALAQGTDRLTQTGAVVGTPTHMAPEQFSSDRSLLGPQTDVWALGVLLYEALTGLLPFEGPSLPELYAAIRIGEPPPPRSLEPSIPRGFEAVCLRALRVDAAQRYPDGAALANDLDRALRGETVGAGGRRIQRFALPVLAGGVVLAVLAGGLWRPADPAQVDAAKSASPAPGPRTPDEASGTAALRALRKLDDPLAIERATASWLRTHADHSRAGEVRALRRRTVRSPLRVVRHLRVQQAKLGADLRAASHDGEDVQLWDLARGEPTRRLNTTYVRVLAYDPQRRRLALGGAQGALLLVKGDTGDPLTTLHHATLFVSSVAFSPNGTRVAVGGRRQVWIRSLPSGDLVQELEIEGRSAGISFSRDGRLLAGASQGGGSRKYRVSVWPLGQKTVREQSLVSRPNCVAFSPREDLFVVGDTTGSLHLFDRLGDPQGRFQSATRELGHPGEVADLVFSPDGRRVYSVSASSKSQANTGNDLRVWDVQARRQLGRPHLQRRSRFGSVDLSRDGRYLLLTSVGEGTLELWHVDAFRD